MCRLAYLPNEALALLTEEQIKEFIEFLTKIHGGDGLGFGGFIEGIPHLNKGVKLSAEAIAEEIKSMQWDHGVILHTRSSSFGSIRDENCHPFLHGNTLLAHNGHWSAAKDYQKFMILMGEEFTGLPFERMADITDSEIIAFLIAKHGPAASDLASGVILTMSPDEVRIHKHQGSFKGFEMEPGVWVFASSLSWSLQQKKDHYELGSNSIAYLNVLNDSHPLVVQGKFELEKYVPEKPKPKDPGKGYWKLNEETNQWDWVVYKYYGQPVLPSGPSQHPHSKRTGVVILDRLDDVYNEILKKSEGREGGKVGKKKKGRHPWKFTKSQKKLFRKAAKVILKRLGSVDEVLRFDRITRLSQSERAALEFFFQVHVRPVALPGLPFLDLARHVRTYLKSKSGGN